MSTTDTHYRRPLVFVLVFVTHAAVIVVFSHVEPQIHFSKPIYEPLVFLLLSHKRQSTAHLATPPATTPPKAKLPKRQLPEPSPDNAITVTPETQPSAKIDWDHESQWAVQNALTNAEKERNYRDLAALSWEQLKWVRENQLVHAAPGIPWTYRRVEVTKSGFPLIHINDHCVVIPLLMMMVFCKIGHIEPNGDLFQHMH